MVKMMIMIMIRIKMIMMVMMMMVMVIMIMMVVMMMMMMIMITKMVMMMMINLNSCNVPHASQAGQWWNCSGSGDHEGRGVRPACGLLLSRRVRTERAQVHHVPGRQHVDRRRRRTVC